MVLPTGLRGSNVLPAWQGHWVQPRSVTNSQGHWELAVSAVGSERLAQRPRRYRKLPALKLELLHRAARVC